MKYKLLRDESKVVWINGKPWRVYRIQATRTFETLDGTIVHADQKGGWMDEHSNMDNEDGCWLWHDSVLLNSQLKECAQVLDTAVVESSVLSGRVEVSGSAMVLGGGDRKNGSWLSDHVVVTGLVDRCRLLNRVQVHGRVQTSHLRGDRVIESHESIVNNRRVDVPELFCDACDARIPVTSYVCVECGCADVSTG